MRWSRPRAERSCWSTFSRASARRRWSIARGEGANDGACPGDDRRDAVAALAQSGGLARDGRRFRDLDRGLAAVVDFACGSLQRPDASLHGAVSRRPRVPAITDAPDLRGADRAGPARTGGNAV